MSVLQDVLTDLSAECENLPVEGVPGACYAHKVHSKMFFNCAGHYGTYTDLINQG